MRSEQERFEEVLEIVRLLHKDKNDNYGSSFERLLNDEGIIAGFIPLANKLHRIRELKNRLGNDHDGIPNSKGDEDILRALEDSALDIGVYGLKLYTWLLNQKHKRMNYTISAGSFLTDSPPISPQTVEYAEISSSKIDEALKKDDNQ